MPSTFTSNTGIELIADGDQAGAWGQTTNDNFDIIDRALNGSVSVSLSGTTHTLTTASGVLSDGQFAVLVFTGSPSGTNTVTIAPNTAQKTYFVTNSTAQTVVLSQGSGANVSVPAGTSKIVFSNGAGAGAAVFDITNTLSGNITGNASTATALQTARTIGGVSFNGTANINLPGVNVTGNQNTTGSAASLTTARTIGGVSFNGTANINLPGVNVGGNQNTTGSAASLTTARTFTIGGTGKTFNGTANVAWSLAEIGVNNSTLTLATSGIATGGQTWTSNQGTNATFTVNVPATNLTYSAATTTGTVNSSTGSNATIPAATTSLAGLMTNADKTKLNGIAAGAQVNVPTNLTYSAATTTGTINSSTGSNATIPAATTTLAGLMTNADKTKLNGIQAGAQVNVGTNLSVTNGTTAGPTINSSTGSNVTFPTASGTISGAVTTGTQTFAGTKTFSGAVILGQAGTATNRAVRADRTITTGDGITGGGNLTANRTFAVDSTVVRTSRTITAGTGLTGGGNLSANRTINAVTLSQAQVEDPNSTVVGSVTGQRLAQAVAANAAGLPAPGEIGSFIFARGPSTTAFGGVVAGSSLTHAGALNSLTGTSGNGNAFLHTITFNSGASGTPAGSWVCLGHIAASASVVKTGPGTASASATAATLWQRVA